MALRIVDVADAPSGAPGRIFNPLDLFFGFPLPSVHEQPAWAFRQGSCG